MTAPKLAEFAEREMNSKEITGRMLELERVFGAAKVRRACKDYLLRKTYADEKQVEKRRPIPWQWVKDTIARQEFKCKRCGQDFTQLDRQHIHGDHRVPLARGGKHNKKNVDALHATCNQKKGANDFVQESKLTGNLITQQL